MTEKTKGGSLRDPRFDEASATKRTVPEMPAAGGKSPVLVRPPPAAPDVAALKREVSELKAALEKERAEREEDDKRMGEMLARVSEREAAATAAERRAERAMARIQLLETELATAGHVAHVLDEQLQATGAGFESAGGLRLAEERPAVPNDFKRRAESAERERDALRDEITRLRERMEDMRARTEAMTDALEGLKRAVARATVPPRW